MDPFSQGVVGAVAGQQVSRSQDKLLAAMFAGLAGMAPDLDVLIRSESDPLLFLEYHRHFTHSLLFIPIGALLCALVFNWIWSRFSKSFSLSFRETYIFCLAGYATHALLDACTTYGTQLFWPLSDMRVAWNTVSVIDPLFTLPLFSLLVVSVLKKTKTWALVAAVYGLAYLGLGLAQQQRAFNVAEQLALERGHTPTELGVKPSFANLLVWKSVYLYQDQYYVDAVRVGVKERVYTGVSVEKLDLSTHFSWLSDDLQQANDVERFRWFSNSYLALDPSNSNRIIDVRYSLVPNEITGMWGIVLDANAKPDQHVTWTTSRPEGEQLRSKTKLLWSMILGID